MRDQHRRQIRPSSVAWTAEQGMAALRDLLGTPGRAGRPVHETIRPTLLTLLAERPMHGSQLIEEIQQRSAGAWRPSPGSVYPTLQMLTDEGLVSADTTGERTMYSLTDHGVQAATTSEVPTQDSPIRRATERASALSRAGLRLGQTLTQFGPDATPAQVERAVQVVDEARRKLHQILAED